MNRRLLIIIMLLSTFLLGCNPNKSNFPKAYSEEYGKRLKEAQDALEDSNVLDKERFRETIDMVSWSIDRGVDYELVVFFEGTPIYAVRDRAVAMNDKEYRALMSANLTLAVIDAAKSLQGNITEVRLSWIRYADLFHGNRYYTILDQNGDGSWDKAAKSDWYYPTVTSRDSFKDFQADKYDSFRTLAKLIDAAN